MRRDYGVIAIAALVAIGLLFEFTPPIGRAISSLAGYLTLVVVPLGLAYVCLTQVQSRNEAIYVGLLGTILTAILMFPFDFARALRQGFGGE